MLLENLFFRQTCLLTGMPVVPVDGRPPRLSRALSNLDSREDANVSKDYVFTGERPQDRTIYLLLSIFVLVTMSLLIGSRFDGLRRNAVMKRNITSILVLTLFVFTTMLTISLAVMLVGQGVPTYRQCSSATWICLTFYSLSKSTIYLFLVERIHVVRAPYVRRSRDVIYLACTVCMFFAFGGILINAWIQPYASMHPTDGRCHMGLPNRVTLPFVIIDVVADLVYTCVFIHLLRPVVKQTDIPNVFRSLMSRQAPESVAPPTQERESRESAVQKSIKTLLWKSMVAAFSITAVTIGLFVVQFHVASGKGTAFVCSIICLLDVYWGFIVIYWLTFTSAQAEKDLHRSTHVIAQSAGTDSQSVTLCESCAVKCARISANRTHGDSASLPTPLDSADDSVLKVPDENAILAIHPK